MKKTTERIPLLHCALFISILALAAFLRFYCLACSSLWHDEGNSWAVAQRSFERIAAAAAADIHPPGYYWLLKLWGETVGFTVAGMRSLSACAGLLTLAVVYLTSLEIGEGAPRNRSSLGLLAALLAALNPFQVFYSQEARMYALLMLESATLIWALLAMKRRWAAPGRASSVGLYAVIYLLAAAAGLWTHYFFAVVLAAGAAVWWWPGGRKARRPREDETESAPRAGARAEQSRPRSPNPWRPLLFFLILNGLALLIYIPWLQTGAERLLNWPAENGFVGPLEGLRLALESLTAGPIRTAPRLAWGWLLLVGALPLLGLWRLRRSDAGAALLLWLLLPSGVMFGFGLFTPAFLKFLLIMSPAWCLTTAAAAQPFSTPSFPGSTLRRWLTTSRAGAAALARFGRPAAFGAIAALAAALALATLPGYYADPAARDNYAGIARTVVALGDPAKDLVILNAPGQADVWRFYDVGVDMLPLPSERPPNRAKTEETLAKATANRRRIFAILWATEQSDREGIVEGWLGRRAFKGLESWQGHVRFATYTLPHGLSCSSPNQPPRFGKVADLVDICLSDGALASGETLLVGLRWRPLATPERRLKVTVQLLDARNQVVVQRDDDPGGGALPTLAWRADEIVVDNHGLPIPPGAPPGGYRLIVALYDAETGARLPVQSGDTAQIARLTLDRPARQLPPTVIPMQRRVNRKLGPVTLVGYDYHRKAFAHAPRTPLAPGDILQITLYWQAPASLPDSWPADLALYLRLGDQAVDAPLAAGSYPTGLWQAGELVRSAFDIMYDGSDPVLWLEVGDARMQLARVPIER